MEANKWYKKLSNGKYWLLSAYTGVLKSTFVSPGHDVVDFYNTDFDPTPHTRTTFPNMPNLIERVSKIDPAAAEWLEFGDHFGTDFNQNQGTFRAIFVWRESPQGMKYWSNICKLLEKKDEQRSAPMQKKYEYEATGTMSISLGSVSQRNPCDIEFGKFAKWYLGIGGSNLSDKGIIDRLLKEQRFSWLNWLSENTPFVKRTEKKAFRFTPDTIRLAFSEDGMVNSALEIKGTDGRWWTVLTFCRDGNIYYALYCKNLPVQMDGDKISIK